ncbi:proteasome accessory factor PafA2 family protein [Candidatus Woesearchaeota archaeon]|nr:proteasome accessory factor PafA2 family protein [Candidatus Woesearchaeota archaeon]
MAELCDRSPVLHRASSGNRFCTYFANGSCAYIDRSAYVEYCLPECNSVAGFVAHDRAGMLRLEDAVSATEERMRTQGALSPAGRVFMLKNNVAFMLKSNVALSTGSMPEEVESTFGTHENYSVNSEELGEALRVNMDEVRGLAKFYHFSFDTANPLGYVAMLLVPFLVSRQILCGAGSVVSRQGKSHYQMSQRSRWMQSDIGDQTVNNRSIVNLRNEPHAAHYLRLHLICGDANMCQYSNWLKMGTTGWVVRMIEENFLPPWFFQIGEALPVLHMISEDVGLKEKFPVHYKQGEHHFSAIDMQQCFLDRAVELKDKNGASPEEQFTLNVWQETLDLLRSDPQKLVGRIDWITKQKLLEEYMQRSGLTLEHPRVQALDQKYHLLSQKDGAFYRWEAKNPSWKVVSDDAVVQARTVPPRTRAEARTRLAVQIHKSKGVVSGMDWDKVSTDEGTQVFALPDPFDPDPYPSDGVEHIVERDNS